MAGENAIRNRKNGGVGIKNLKSHNESLLLKWYWKFNKDKSIWGRLLAENLTLDNPRFTKESTEPHGIWKHMHSYGGNFTENYGFLLGNGRKIRFWEDAWLSLSSLKAQFSGFLLFTTP